MTPWAAKSASVTKEPSCFKRVFFLSAIFRMEREAVTVQATAAEAKSNILTVADDDGAAVVGEDGIVARLL